MNGCLGFSVRALRGTGAIAAAGLAVAGCADLRRAVSSPPVNPESPVAGVVAAGSTRNYATPLLVDVPPAPRNVPSAAAVKLDVATLVGCHRAMSGYVAAHPPLTGGTAAFAADAREIAAINPADVASPDSAAKAEAYADTLRAEAAPPAAIASGPAPTPAQGMPPAPAAPGAPAARHASGHHRNAPAAPVDAAQTPSAMPAAEAAPAAEMGVTVPPLPAAQADPLLARCT